MLSDSRRVLDTLIERSGLSFQGAETKDNNIGYMAKATKQEAQLRQSCPSVTYSPKMDKSTWPERPCSMSAKRVPNS